MTPNEKFFLNLSKSPAVSRHGGRTSESPFVRGAVNDASFCVSGAGGVLQYSMRDEEK
jgi:hypothetical protein